jgi:hypothetical protein
MVNKTIAKLKLTLNRTMAGLLSLTMALATSAVEAGQSPEYYIRLGFVLLVIYIITGGGKLILFVDELLKLYKQFGDVKVAKTSEQQLLNLANEVDKLEGTQSIKSIDIPEEVSINRD